MKIAIITSTFPPYNGGMGNSAAEIAQILALKHEITVFTPQQAYGDKIHDFNFAIEYVKPTWQIGHGAVLMSLWGRLKDFDIIYLHYPFYGTAEIIWLYKILHPSIKLIIHFHMDTPHLAWNLKILSWPLLFIKNSLMSKADKIITASLDYTAHSSIKKVWQKSPTKFIEIPFGVHLHNFHVLPHDIALLMNLRQRYNISEKDRVIMFLGGLDSPHKFKGVDILLEAFAMLIHNHKNFNISVKLLICGDGNLRYDYEQKAEKLKINSLVIFTGRVPAEELILHYNLADVFVLPSVDTSEAFGVVLLEAMACGVPVMASNLPGVRSVFENGVQGYTVAPKSARHLRRKLEEFLKYPQTRWKMGRAARELVEKKYNWSIIEKQFEELIKELNFIKNENSFNQ